jgi:hypothetical protein
MNVLGAEMLAFHAEDLGFETSYRVHAYPFLHLLTKTKLFAKAEY